MTRVLLVGRGRPESGGIAVFLETLATARLGDGVDVDLLNLTRPDGMGDGGTFSLANLRRTLEDCRTLWDRAAEHDIVHIHSAVAPRSTMLRAGLLATVARARGARVVVHAHGGRLVSFADERGARATARLALGSVSQFVAVSAGVEQALRSLVADTRVTRIPNGVDTDRFTPTDPGARATRPRILYVGHLTERKGVLDLLDASEALVSRGLDHELVLVGGRSDDGDGAYRAVIDRLPDRVRHVPAVEHDAMPELYRTADIFCLASWWEAMPLSVLEAMASGLPVVATAVGEIPAIVADGTSGLLVEPRDLASLVDALATLLDDEQARRRLGSRGREIVLERFDLGSTLEQITDLYTLAAATDRSPLPR